MEPTTATSSGAERLRILVVDDREENLVAMEAVLTRLDADLVTVRSGEQALAQLIRRDFAVILLDVQMPGMDGFETAALIQGNQDTRHIPIIFVTAISKEERYVFKGYEAGAVDYLFKPIEGDILRSKVRVFLELARRREELKAAHRLILEKERAVAAHQQERLRLERESAEALREKSEQLRETSEELSRSNKELEQFAFVVSHDLQEPLRMVSSYLQLLERRYKGQLDTSADEFIHFAVDGADRMKGLILDLLAYSRVGTQGGELRATDLAQVLDDVTRDLEVALKEAGARIEAEGLPRVMADPRQASQLLQNLIGNAVKFRGEAAPQVRVEAAREGRLWHLQVSDNGIGIAPQFNDQIFGVFKRLHTREEYSGSGIGLAICKKITERHGGRIWVESAPGEGATFHFTLPAAEVD